MISLTRIGKFQISNKVAMASALALLLTTLSGFGTASIDSGTESIVSTETVAADLDSEDNKSRKLSISLLLFGKG